MINQAFTQPSTPRPHRHSELSPAGPGQVQVTATVSKTQGILQDVFNRQEEAAGAAAGESPLSQKERAAGPLWAVRVKAAALKLWGLGAVKSGLVFTGWPG